MKVALFGGSFNPPTLGHEAIARACLEHEYIDEMWLMPSGDRWDKQYAVDDYHRLRMLEFMVQRLDNPRVHVSQFELSLPRPTQTTTTLGALATAYPRVKPILVFGTDSYWSMPAWNEGEYLQQNLQMLIVPRQGYPNPQAANIDILHISTDLQGISSSEVRDKAVTGQKISHLVDPWIEAYITENDLYALSTTSK